MCRGLWASPSAIVAAGFAADGGHGRAAIGFGLFHIVGRGLNNVADKVLFADRGAIGVVLEDIRNLGCVMPVVADHEEQWDAVFLCESEGSRCGVVVPRPVAEDADDNLLRACEFDAERRRPSKACLFSLEPRQRFRWTDRAATIRG